MAFMEALLMTLAAIGGGASIVFVANRLSQARARLDTLRNLRQRDRPRS
jgi:hypothetical protein